jgi:hypothetical protein
MADVAAERIANATPIMPFQFDEAINKIIRMYAFSSFCLLL